MTEALTHKLSLPIHGIELGQHSEMVHKIRKLPDIKYRIWTQIQTEKLEDRRLFWQFIGNRIDFFQKEEFGIFPIQDPLILFFETIPQENFVEAIPKELIQKYAKGEIEICTLKRFFIEISPYPLTIEYLTIVTRYFYRMLKLIIKAFPKIQERALSLEKGFNLVNPRSFFAEICRELANAEIEEDIASRSINSLNSIKRSRDGLTEVQKFCRRNLTPEEEVEVLNSFEQDTERCIFWLAPVWQKIYFEDCSSDLRQDWQNFLTSLKQLVRFVKNDTPTNGFSLVMPKWIVGYPIDPKTGKRIGNNLVIFKTFTQQGF